MCRKCVNLNFPKPSWVSMAYYRDNFTAVAAAATTTYAIKADTISWLCKKSVNCSEPCEKMSYVT
jgi:hypothetical protein